MKKEPEQFFQELKKDVTTYAELKVELLKLGAYERTGKVISVLLFGMILVSLLFFLTLFIFIALGLFLSEWLGSYGIGFSIVSALYLLLIGAALLLKNKIQTSILNIVISALMDNDKQNNNDAPTENKTDPVSETPA